MPVDAKVTELRVEYGRGRGHALGIGVAAPRLSWITETEARDWAQTAYEIEIADGGGATTTTGRVDSNASVFVPWPGEPLTSRQQVTVRVRVWGGDGAQSEWSEALSIEAGLLSPADWTASWISPTAIDPPEHSSPAPYFRRAFTAESQVRSARLYVTSMGVHQVELNGQVVGDHVLAPGWTSYHHRLRYDTHDVTALVVAGDNALGVVVGDGWFRGHMGLDATRNSYGDRAGLLAQLELTYADGRVERVVTDDQWRTATGPILASDIYNGEDYDARLILGRWSTAGYDDGAWDPMEVIAPAIGVLEAPIAPPVRRTDELSVVEVVTTPSGKTVLDFGQNFVGWVRLTVDGPVGTKITLRHAEVLEHGEIATRPLRLAKATDSYILRGGGPERWEPTFTFHGFRYVEVDGWPGPLDPSACTGIVVHTDMERTGTFECSHELLNQLHANVVWGMRGNFLDVPTDCPQRSERLGWTGDIQVFGPTATFLYDVGGFLADWLADVAAEQFDSGGIPFVVPNQLGPRATATAAWGDVATFLPWTLYERYGDVGILERQFHSMRKWVDCIRDLAGESRLWAHGFQFGDWLDPDAPPDEPARAKTDAHLIATAYFARSAQIVSDAAAVLGQEVEAARYGVLAAEVRAAFRDEYVTPNGRMASDSQTAYALALCFDLFDNDAHRQQAVTQLRRLARRNRYRIGTGFVGTPLVCHALSKQGDDATAYRLLTETECPSWLYPVTMGATTVWERWDSMLPDGTVNIGQMNSFNHYALGSVADWMHQRIGGLAPAAPGYRRIRVAPVPGPGVTHASTSLRTPYGRASVSWSVEGTSVSLVAIVPPSTTATVHRPGIDEPVEVGSGRHEWTYNVDPSLITQWADDLEPAR